MGERMEAEKIMAQTIESIRDAEQKARRERIATACLQGILADPNASPNRRCVAEWAVEYADALIAELDK